MKIGIVLSAPPGYSETFFNSKIKGLKAHGFKVYLITQATSKTYDACHVIQQPKIFKNPIRQLLMMFIVYLRLLPKLSHVVRFVRLEREQGVGFGVVMKKIYLGSHMFRLDLDWLHFGFATQAIGYENVAAAIKAKMAVSLRGFDINVYPLKHPNCYNLVWERVNKVHSISENLLQKAHNYGLPKNKSAKIITPAIDIAKMNTIEGFEAKNNTLKIVTIARLHWIKGIDFAINTMHLLKEKNMSFEYHIIGSGSPVEIERYTLQIHQLGLENHIHLHGKLSHQDALMLLKTADIYLQTSIQEGFCNAVLEAQALGLLTIATAAGAIPENIDDTKTGWILKKRTIELLAQKIIDVKNLPSDEKHQMSQNAKNRVRENFSLQQQQKQFIDFYLADS